jgi:hypothetical protein
MKRATEKLYNLKVEMFNEGESALFQDLKFNPVKFWTYTIIPKNIDPSKKYPLMVLPHGGVHIWF